MESASPIKSLPQYWFGVLRLSPPKKNEERCVKTVLESGLSCCAEQVLNCVKEMGDWQLTCNESASPIKSLPQYWFGMLTLSPPKNKEKCVKTVLESGLFCCTKQVLNCLQEMGDYWWPAMESASSIMSLPQSWFVMLRLGPPKKKEESVKTVLKTGLFYCTEQILNCVQEMGDWQLTCNGVSFTH